ncbi:MAG: protein serine/threonine phosphatase [Bacteroidetes bacterium]|nr:MAG: protein serine/threonine phosphatase [Bacteroidota bacterium]
MDTRRIAEELRDARDITQIEKLIGIVRSSAQQSIQERLFELSSKSFEKTLGYTEAELLGNRFGNFVAEEDRDKTAREYDALTKGNISSHFENRYKCKDGSLRWLAWRSVAVAEENRIYAIARDISRQKESEKRIIEYAENLHDLIDQKNEGLRYARMLQDAIFPDYDFISHVFPDSFIYSQSKDIVSGDFFWFDRVNNGKVFMACTDCTGHGVPGALLSIMGVTYLNTVVTANPDEHPAVLLTELNKLICKTLDKKHSVKVIKDGMEISLISYDYLSGRLEYAGAGGAVWLVRKGELEEIKGDRLAIGMEPDCIYEGLSRDIDDDTVLYMFSDGFADQFGGINGKKFMRQRLKNTVISISHLPMHEQKLFLQDTMEKWMGNQDQLDDISISGVLLPGSR